MKVDVVTEVRFSGKKKITRLHMRKREKPWIPKESMGESTKSLKLPLPLKLSVPSRTKKEFLNFEHYFWQSDLSLLISSSCNKLEV